MVLKVVYGVAVTATRGSLHPQILQVVWPDRLINVHREHYMSSGTETGRLCPAAVAEGGKGDDEDDGV